MALVAAVESIPSSNDIEDEDIEEEFKKLELEVGGGKLQVLNPKTRVDGPTGQVEVSVESLSDALSNVKLTGNTTGESAIENRMASMRENKSKDLELEAA